MKSMEFNIVDKSRKKLDEQEKRHQAIIDAAIALFNENGYKATTTVEIANKAKTSEATMYKHFNSKAKLYLTCFRSIIDMLVAAYQEVYKQHRDDELGYLNGLIKAYMDFVKKNPDKSMFLLQCITYKGEPEINKALKDYVILSIKTVESVIEAAKRKGKIKHNIDSNMMAYIFVMNYFTLGVFGEYSDLANIKMDLLCEGIQRFFSLSK
jgi:AcrR family transcriptional regulator